MSVSSLNTLYFTYIATAPYGNMPASTGALIPSTRTSMGEKILYKKSFMYGRGKGIVQ